MIYHEFTTDSVVVGELTGVCVARAARNGEKVRRGASRQTSLVTSAASALREIRRHGSGFALLLLAATTAAAAEAQPTLSDAACRLEWAQSADGWRLGDVTVRSESGDLRVGAPSGEYTFLYSAEPPSKTSIAVPWSGPGGAFPEPVYRYLTRKWKDVTNLVSLNVAGEARSFFPAAVERMADGEWSFRHFDDTAKVQATWSLDPAFPGDVCVTLTLTAIKPGWFSLATPTLATVAPAELAWAVIPGVFQGAAFEPDFVRAYAYGQGLPERPVVVRERTASTLASLLTAKSGATLAVIAEPGTAADPWENDRDTRGVWRLGLSHMNRRGALAPTLYHPVLGEKGSQLAAGESRTFRFRYTLRSADWFTVEKHAIYDIYRFADFLALKRPARSLTERLLAMHRYVVNDETSMWRTEDFAGLKIGAQAYLGGVIGSDKDAMKNSDYGAMWMLARLTGDPRLTRDRLPFARAFKLAQQQAEPGFFQGAAVGQYYLSKSRRFTEEWGEYVEPVALTYYAMLDLGNILLFEPADAELRARLRLGADRLLGWQRADGSWDVAYDRHTEKPLFNDVRDYRPTFYGLLVAYRILGDEKYLAAARRGADWLVREAVEPGRFLGVCGDARFVPDFATAQIAGALLDLFEVTHDTRHRDAAVRTARFYTNSIYTHPIPSRREKTAGGATRADWEISQAGLNFEHGGLIGSATTSGPILLASHAGLFIRVHALTGEPLFRDMARAGALARDAFVDPKSSVASYYWKRMNEGPGRFPHHAWWQIGWITDYLVSEAALRTRDRVTFPRGFMTPKVGPHASYGFAPGRIHGELAALRLTPGLVHVAQPSVDFLTAQATDARRLFVVLLNERPEPQTAAVSLDAARVSDDQRVRWTKAALIDAEGETTALRENEGSWSVPIPGFGAAVLRLDFEDN